VRRSTTTPKHTQPMMMPTRMVSSEAVLKAVLANEVSSRGGEGGGGEGGG